MGVRIALIFQRQPREIQIYVNYYILDYCSVIKDLSMNEKDLRIVFMGTPDFAVGSLKALIENGYNVVGVVTVPDRPSGRGLKLHQSDVKQYATSQGLPVMQPEKLKDESFLEILKFLNPDIQVVVAFRMLPEVIWKMPPMGTFNLHASLLPNYRGAAPLNWAIINGDQETGVTTFLLKHEIDAGNILFQSKVKIGSEETFGELHDKLKIVGAKLVLKTIDTLAGGAIIPFPQNLLPVDAERLYAPKIFKEDCKIDWTKPTTAINNLIRGLSPQPGAWTNINLDKSEDSMKIF
jgi:methionyl-tRNA formyltransferase